MLTTTNYTGMKLIGHPLILILMMIMVTATLHVSSPDQWQQYSNTMIMDFVIMENMPPAEFNVFGEVISFGYILPVWVTQTMDGPLQLEPNLNGRNPLPSSCPSRLKLKESSCRDPSKVDCIPSHTSGISQSSSSSLTYTVDMLPIDLDGEALDDSNGSLERPQDTTRAVLKDSVPKDDTSWGGWSSEQSYIPGTDTKAEEEWGVINDTSCHDSNVHLLKKDTITCTTVQIKDWQWIDIMARKFASRAIATYGLLSHKMLLTSLNFEIVGYLGNLFLDFGCSVPPDAQLWGEIVRIIFRAMHRDEHKYKEEEWGVIDQDYNIYTLTQDLIDLQFSGNTLLSGTGSHPSQYVYYIKFGSSVSLLYISIVFIPTQFPIVHVMTMHLEVMKQTV